MRARADERRVRLADGRQAKIRPIRASDREAFLAFHAGLSEESRYLRYFSARRKLPERELRHYTEVDQRDHAGVVTLVDGALVGHALYDRLSDAEEAEVALEVADAFQGLGIGTLMLEELAHLALRAGFPPRGGTRPAGQPAHAPGLPRPRLRRARGLRRRRRPRRARARRDASLRFRASSARRRCARAGRRAVE